MIKNNLATLPWHVGENTTVATFPGSQWENNREGNPEEDGVHDQITVAVGEVIDVATASWFVRPEQIGGVIVRRELCGTVRYAITAEWTVKNVEYDVSYKFFKIWRWTTSKLKWNKSCEFSKSPGQSLQSQYHSFVFQTYVRTYKNTICETAGTWWVKRHVCWNVP